MRTRWVFLSVALGVALHAMSGTAKAQCTASDNGSGTVTLPPANCQYLSPANLHEIINGLPAGTTIEIGAQHFKFFNVTSNPGGSLGGDREQSTSILRLVMDGTGSLANFHRTKMLNNVQMITDTGPRTPGMPVQSFDNDMVMLQGQLPAGDPDFDLLRITAGTGFGMPSPGHTTLVRQGPPGSNWAVDSFFDVTYRIDFVGHSPGPLAGHSGSTTGTIRMQTGFPGPCSECGPGPHWIHNPPCPPGGFGSDTVSTGARIGIDTNGDCIPDIAVDASGPTTITKRGPFDDSTNFPGTRPNDGHLDVLDTEIVAMNLSGGGVTVKAGTASGSAQPLAPSRGATAEQSGDPTLADSFFDVFLEVNNGGQLLYNQQPLIVTTTVDCAPPDGNFLTVSGCTPLFTSPQPGGQPTGINIVGVKHFTYPACCRPTGCINNVPPSQCTGVVVASCLGDANGNGIDDACDPRCEVDPASPSHCTQQCPPPIPPNAACLPTKSGCDPNHPGSCGVLECDCIDDTSCRMFFNAAGHPFCQGNCPVPPGGNCQLLGSGAIGDPYYCDCGGGPPVCQPTSDGSACVQNSCNGPIAERCDAKCAKVDPLTGQVTITDCDCNPFTGTDTTCHMELGTGLPRGPGGPCEVNDNGGGTVTLPPAGCDYLSPDDVHEILNGLPPNTTVEFAAIHKDFICGGHPGGNSVCSWAPPPGVCDQPGGSLGGEQECAQSTLQATLTGKCTGGAVNAICNYNRTLQIPVEFETHTAPRNPGDPVQSFDTDMFRLFGQLPAGDPDFDLLRVSGGTNFNLPSPGHTTLTKLPGGNWAVDSFFDVTYRIDYVGHSPGPFAGRSGSTTATIRMQTNAPFKCRGVCPAGMTCVQTTSTSADGTTKVCCDCVQPVCEPNPQGSDCNPNTCPAPEKCLKKCVKWDPLTNTTTVTDCDCKGPDDCHVEYATPNEPRGGPDDCIVNNVGGTVNLPPPGCDYLSPDDVHMIIDGLPVTNPPTTIVVAAEHKFFFCEGCVGGINNGLPCSSAADCPGGQCRAETNPVCSHSVQAGCDQPGGGLGGESECSQSTLALAMTGTGNLAGFNRNIALPAAFETHTAPRTPGQPIQSFDTDMFRLFGQITNPGSGDPDFDLLRIVGGSDFGLPSPGHTTLTQLPGGNWAVDSFFDVTYRIDFVGRPGGALGGMSGSTTGTIRMQTKTPFKCRGVCAAGTKCIQTAVSNADGTLGVCCDCVSQQTCAPLADGSACNQTMCATGEPCRPTKIVCSGPAPQICRITECGCGDTCHVIPGTAAAGPACTGPCTDPVPPNHKCVRKKSQVAGGIQYECKCIPVYPPPTGDPTGILKNRYLTMNFGASAGAARGTPLQAIRVKMVSLMHPDPPNLPQFPPPNFTAFEGQSRWVGPPSLYTETESPFSQFMGSGLQCDPNFQDWSGVGTVQVFAGDIVPSSMFDVQTVDVGCDIDEEDCYSSPLNIATGRSGDVASAFQQPSPNPLTQPNISDIVAVVDKFKGLAGAPIVARGDLHPALPNRQVNIADVTIVIDAFKNFAYPFPGPCACPPIPLCPAVDACGRCHP